jgi:hypothetical protein
MMPVSDWRQLSHRFHARSEERGLYVNKGDVRPLADPERSTSIMYESLAVSARVARLGFAPAARFIRNDGQSSFLISMAL